MRLFIGYATIEGQSRKIARWVADRLVDAGLSVEVLPLKDADDLDLARFDKAVLVASVHAGHYNKYFASFVSDHASALGAVPTLFLSVSLAAAGHDAEEWRDLDRILGEMTDATGWTPAQAEHVAGAYMPSRYDMLTRFIMRRIVSKKDPDANLDADHEYTDWDALGAVIDAWHAG